MNCWAMLIPSLRDERIRAVAENVGKDKGSSPDLRLAATPSTQPAADAEEPEN